MRRISTAPHGLALLLGLLSSPLAAQQPGNPVSLGETVCVAHEGVHCFQGRNGDLQWQALTGSQTHRLSHDGNHLVTAGSTGIIALDPHTGRHQWHQRSVGPAFTPIAGDDALWAGTHTRGVVRLDADSGRIQWQTPLPGWVYTPARLNNVLVTGGSNHTLWGLNPASGQVLWSRPLPQEVVDSPVAAESRGVVVTPTFDGSLLAVRPSDGTPVWRASLTTPAIALRTDATTVYGLFMGARLAAVALDDGSIRWQRQLAGQPRTLQLIGNRVHVPDQAGSILVIDPATGMTVARHAVPSEPVGAPLANGAVVVRPPLRLLSLTPDSRRTMEQARADNRPVLDDTTHPSEGGNPQ